MHQAESHTSINRRQLLTDTLAMGLAGLTVASFGILVERARTHIARLSPDQEEFLKTVLKANLAWMNRSHDGKEVYEARMDNGTEISIARERTDRSLVVRVLVTGVEHPLDFRCPLHAIDEREKPLLTALFGQARKCSSASR